MNFNHLSIRVAKKQLIEKIYLCYLYLHCFKSQLRGEYLKKHDYIYLKHELLKNRKKKNEFGR